MTVLRHVLVLGALLALTSPAAAYRTAADLPEFDDAATIAWPTREIAYRIHTAMPAGLDRDAVRASIEAAAATWNAVDCTDVRLVFAGFTDEPAVAGDDVNTFAFVLDGWSALGLDADAAATTDVGYASRGVETRINEADLLLNAESFRWALDAGPTDARDLRAVVTHELGHVLGLLHPCELDGRDGAGPCVPSHDTSALHPLYSVRQRALSVDERDGLCALYPTICSGSCNPTPEPECATDVECPSTAWCDRGTCSPRGTHADACLDDSECAGLCAADGWCSSTCDENRDCPPFYACRSGLCASTGGGYGTPCEAGRDCASGVCITGLVRAPDGYCSRPCGDACPAGELCRVIDEQAVCAPPPSSGCAAGGAGSAPSTLFAGFVLALRRRRGKR